MSRRTFISGMAGATGSVAGSAGVTAQTQGGGGSIDYGGWLDDVGYWDEQTADRTGQQAVTIAVGGDPNSGLSFDPVAVHIDSGTSVTWEWTGQGGAHNVVAEDGSFNSGSPVAQAGTTFTRTFDADGITNYYCEPHQSQGMKGAIAVGSVPREAAVQQETDPEDLGVPFQPHYVGISALLTMCATLIFTFYLLKYGESPHTKGGSRR
ncbi:halocyanin domain-containing protein [Halocatena pleomorpha]|uniref:Halocyanin domain-containing protein n=2 Tax=Halocatena pleomorpha TaxID=1785090 RepID=A0A3P3RLJ0_9EURY|nr:halocyanin domain-containing protein [Halocatena pleomorpha]